MKIVIAPDSYKESLSASEVAQAIEKGFREIFPDAQYVSIPVADGGEGTVEAMIAATQGSERHAWVTGPLGEKVNASWGISGDGKTAFIEMAAASGLELVPAEKRDPLVTTSRGTGELILQALESGATNIIIGIGGSATNDGGAGMVQALGAKLCDANGNEISGEEMMLMNHGDLTLKGGKFGSLLEGNGMMGFNNLYYSGGTYMLGVDYDGGNDMLKFYGGVYKGEGWIDGVSKFYIEVSGTKDNLVETWAHIFEWDNTEYETD